MSTLRTVMTMLSLLPLLLFAQVEPMPLDLETALELAWENNRSAKVAKLDHEENKKLTYEVITEGLPKIRANLNYNDNFKLLTSPITIGNQTQFLEFGQKHDMELSVELEQLIIDGRYFVGLKARQSIIKVSEAKMRLDRVGLSEEITKSYYNALVSQTAANLLQTNLRTIKGSVDETAALYEEGFAEELDLDRLKLTLQVLESKIDQADANFENSLNLLKYLCGIPLEEEVRLTEEMEKILSDLDDSDVRFFSYEDRPEFVVLSNQFTLRGYDIKQIKAGYYPALYAYAKYGTYAYRDKWNFTQPEPWFQQGRVGINLQIPIFDGLNRDAKVQQARIRQDRTKVDLEDLMRSSVMQVHVAENQYNTALSQLRDKEDNLALASKIFNKIDLMYKEGVGSSLDLSQAETDLTNSQIDYAQAMYNVLVKRTELDVAAGKFNPFE